MLKPEPEKLLASAEDPLNESVRPRSHLWLWLSRLIGLCILIAIGVTYKQWWPLVDEWIPKPVATAGRPPARPTPVTTAVAVKESVEVHLNALGTITAFNTVTVRSRVDGELKTVKFVEGQSVQPGDLLVELDPRPYEAMRDQALGQMQRDLAQLDLARVNLSRAKILIARDASSQQEYDEQLALFKQAESIVKVDEAMLKNAQLQVDYTRITSPINGNIGLRMVDVGNMVKANDAAGLMVITQLKPISLVFSIPQDDIHRVRMELNKTGNLDVEAYNRDFTTKLATGKLIAIDNQVDATTGTLRLKATFDNEDNLLFPNEFVNVRLKVEVLQDVITIPSQAVQRGPKERFVYVVKPGEDPKENVVDVRTVVVGPTEGLRTVIQSGLEPDEIVVTEGVDKLQPGSKVTLPKPR